ncbi:MAG: ABC transporter ATP-binding protein [Bryobacteraceae bacterium]|nr:ABC transporter ATP-binding protein [Bryobacteraceae bacterium]
MSFTLRALRVAYGSAEVIRGINADFGDSGLVALVGPNGAGKSTLLGAMAGLRDYGGECLFDGKQVRAWSRRELASRVSWVPQSLHLDFPFTAAEVVMMGRTPYAAGLFESPHDAEAVRRALRITDAETFAARDFRSLSGGERQRVILAAALAQEPRVLLLDEPTTFLDLRHQVAIYSLLQSLTRSKLLAIAATHDLNLALTYADRVMALKDGRVAGDGPAPGVLNRERIQEVFGMTVEMLHGPSGRPWITYAP